MRFGRLKLFVGVALIIFVLVVANILFVGKLFYNNYSGESGNFSVDPKYLNVSDNNTVPVGENVSEPVVNNSVLEPVKPEVVKPKVTSGAS